MTTRPWDRERIVELSRDGFEAERIARLTRVSKRTVYRVLSEVGKASKQGSDLALASQESVPKDRSTETHTRHSAKTSGAIAAAVESMPSEAYPGCHCDLRPDMTVAEIRALGPGCTRPRWVCPRLDAVRRRLPRRLRWWEGDN